MTPLIRQVLEMSEKLGIETFPMGVYELLTTGRMDKSGDFTKGAGLKDWQALHILAFLVSGRDTTASRLYSEVAKAAKSMEAAA